MVIGDAIGSMLGLAAGVAVNPLPIVAVILLLGAPRGASAGVLFAAGWLLGLAVLGSVILLIADPVDATSGSGPAAWTGWLKLALGAALLLLAIRQWRKRPAEGEQKPPPKWTVSLATTTPAKAFGLGAFLASLNPKNAALTIAAAASIASTGVSGGAQAVAIGAFVLIGSLGALIPLGTYFLTGDNAAQTLASWQQWFVKNSSAIVAVLFFVIALNLIGSGIGVVT
jgi:threonine/homoserine/homoserine lactone efflux protein